MVLHGGETTAVSVRAACYAGMSKSCCCDGCSTIHWRRLLVAESWFCLGRPWHDGARPVRRLDRGWPSCCAPWRGARGGRA
eukprot:5022859-Pyramimonas_sp.AAC.1